MATSPVASDSASNEEKKTNLIRTDITTSNPSSTIKVMTSPLRPAGSASDEVDQMPRFVLNLVRKVVAKWKGQIGQREQAGLGWACQAAIIAGEDDVVEETDSGYASSGDTPSKPLTEGQKSTDSANAIKYRQLPFREKHYLHTYIQRILEETCVRYAREHLSADFTDPDWKMKHLIFPSSECPPDRLVGRDWLAEDEIELLYWMKTFAERVHGMPKSQRIFESVADLRDAAVHRGDHGDREEFDFEKLSYAMQLPGLFGDSEGASDITNAFRYVMEDPTLDEDTKAATEKAIYTPKPCTTRYQLLERLQTMMEETCFSTAAHQIPDVLARKNWHCPEQIEIGKWEDVFQRYRIQHNDVDIFPETSRDDGSLDLFRDLFYSARLDIRNIAHHRLLVSDGKVVKQVHRAITFCILQGDWNQAIEIEVMAEIYFTKSSREQVLERLERVYRNGKIECAYEERRRLEIAAFLGKVEGREVCSGEMAVLSDTDDVAVTPVLGAVKPERTWSPSMHEALKKVEEF